MRSSGHFYQRNLKLLLMERKRKVVWRKLLHGIEIGPRECPHMGLWGQRQNFLSNINWSFIQLKFKTHRCWLCGLLLRVWPCVFKFALTISISSGEKFYQGDRTVPFSFT